MNAIESILKKALDGERIQADEALELYSAKDVLLLGNVASRLSRKKRDAEIITYIVDRNINYTNICVTDCSFCAFYRKEGDKDAYVLPFETIADKIRETVALGGAQILLQGGHNIHLKIDYYEDLFRKIKENFDIHLHALSPSEIHHIVRVSKLSLKEVLQRLKNAGLDSIPGGGAEILVDRVRQVISPYKCNSDQWLEVMAEAHRMEIPTTATMMFGHVETLEERIEHLIRLRRQQDETGGFTAFIPWTYQPGNTELSLDHKITSAVTGLDYLKTLAISRIVLDNFDNLQSSWVTQGPKIGQVSLSYGANDMGSTMLEENVVAAAGTVHCLDEEAIRRLIKDAGRTPQRRNMRYEYV
ncbi:MAG: dehypoxanthine futalosine cyclase [Candidatus Nitrohelix vancouverensis]|uniref:Cyclic dehypoxanthine futalosine synthase n=1 Tax=Candidatus Nitrohelix vancouverensis TaxID=2705534 RepID=A0A7T0G390_9BACT|nr:MAG: dehypoxanthine futalosine cyclase [Candidatus Nitrohelix vancouverensis]